MKKEYSEKDAESGIKERLPKLKCWRNQFQRDYIIRIIIPENSSYLGQNSSWEEAFLRHHKWLLINLLIILLSLFW